MRAKYAEKCIPSVVDTAMIATDCGIGCSCETNYPILIIKYI